MALVVGDSFAAPRVSDGVIWRVLQALLLLDGERLSYRALDVEQVGSVYESMMGFEVKTLPGFALSVRPKGVVFDVDALLALPPAKRAAWLKNRPSVNWAPPGTRRSKKPRPPRMSPPCSAKNSRPRPPHRCRPVRCFCSPVRSAAALVPTTPRVS